MNAWARPALLSQSSQTSPPYFLLYFENGIYRGLFLIDLCEVPFLMTKKRNSVSLPPSVSTISSALAPPLPPRRSSPITLSGRSQMRSPSDVLTDSIHPGDHQVNKQALKSRNGVARVNLKIAQLCSRGVPIAAIKCRSCPTLFTLQDNSSDVTENQND